MKKNCDKCFRTISKLFIIAFLYVTIFGTLFVQLYQSYNEIVDSYEKLNSYKPKIITFPEYCLENFRMMLGFELEMNKPNNKSYPN